MKLISPYACIARNLKMKLAFRLNADISCTPSHPNKIEVTIKNIYFTYKTILSIDDLSSVSSDYLADHVYKLYRREILSKFFTSP